MKCKRLTPGGMPCELELKEDGSPHDGICSLVLRGGGGPLQKPEPPPRLHQLVLDHLPGHAFPAEKIIDRWIYGDYASVERYVLKRAVRNEWYVYAITDSNLNAETMARCLYMAHKFQELVFMAEGQR